MVRKLILRKQQIMRNKKGSKERARRRDSNYIKFTQQGKHKELCIQHEKKLSHSLEYYYYCCSNNNKKLMPTFQKESLQLKLSVKGIKFKGLQCCFRLCCYLTRRMCNENNIVRKLHPPLLSKLFF